MTACRRACRRGRPCRCARAPRRAVTATVTLSYLASGFDWQADYVATLSEDGSRIDLFAWLTLASSDETSFVDADTQAVAGRLNRQDVRVQPSEGGPLRISCWPQADDQRHPARGICSGWSRRRTWKCMATTP